MMHHGMFLFRIASLIFLFGLQAASGQAQVSARLVSANPHDQNIGSGGQPMSGVTSSSVIDANAYHVGSSADVTAALGFPHRSKPKILSTDDGSSTTSQLTNWLNRACNSGEHFEHFDFYVGQGPLSGSPVNGLGDFPSQSQSALQVISNSHTSRGCPSALSPGGRLTRIGREFYWNNQMVSLVGFSSMGALVSPRFNIPGYLNALQQHKVNLTRVWAIEQWTAFEVNNPDKNLRGTGYTPFGLNYNIFNQSWNLNFVDSLFLQRLESFVSAASQRGIVVQLTLFDRHGLRNKNLASLSRWTGSPYNVNNNVNTLLSPGCTDKAPKSFIDTSGAIGSVNSNYIQKVVDRLDGYGNVIFEIMNEPLEGTNGNCDWTSTPLRNWHNWVANQVKNAP